MSKYIQLKMKCPCEHEPGDNDMEKRQVYEWVHSRDSKPVEINSDAWVRCSSLCGANSPFIDWRFNCGKHSANEYKKASKEYITAALINVLQAKIDYSKTDDVLFFAKLAGNVAQQCM